MKLPHFSEPQGHAANWWQSYFWTLKWASFPKSLISFLWPFPVEVCSYARTWLNPSCAGKPEWLMTSNRGECEATKGLNVSLWYFKHCSLAFCRGKECTTLKYQKSPPIGFRSLIKCESSPHPKRKVCSFTRFCIVQTLKRPLGFINC